MIQPGGQGKVKIKLRTQGYGGRQLTKRIQVITDDPEHSTLMLTMVGDIEQVAKISPRKINLTGVTGEKLGGTVTVSSTEKYPFF